MHLVEWAEQTAAQHLAQDLPRRWSHVQGVAARAGVLAAGLGEDGPVLRAAAWLHDVGYAPSLALTGFHPLDGARYLRSIGMSDRIVNLVACHSAAELEAAELGVSDQYKEFKDERTIVRDLLWFADMTIGPDGQRVNFEQRMLDVRERYKPDHYVIRALDTSMSERKTAVNRAEEWAKSAGLIDQL